MAVVWWTMSSMIIYEFLPSHRDVCFQCPFLWDARHKWVNVQIRPVHPSNHSFHCPFKRKLHTIESVVKRLNAKWECTYVQVWLGICCLFMNKERYLRDTANITKTRLFKYIDNFTTKKPESFQIKIWYFPYFCSKHRLWVLVRTASARGF